MPRRPHGAVLWTRAAAETSIRHVVGVADVVCVGNDPLDVLDLRDGQALQRLCEGEPEVWWLEGRSVRRHRLIVTASNKITCWERVAGRE